MQVVPTLRGRRRHAIFLDMQSDNRFLDDLARLATGAMGALNGARQEVDQLIRSRMERLLSDLDLVPREEFEAVREMAVRAREENERLAERVAALESSLAGLRRRPSAAAAAPKGKSRAAKPTPKAPLKPTRARKA
jgi:BMFP domain-containing protein YqiC